jgi:hypothetical protein
MVGILYKKSIIILNLMLYKNKIRVNCFQLDFLPKTAVLWLLGFLYLLPHQLLFDELVTVFIIDF